MSGLAFIRTSQGGKTTPIWLNVSEIVSIEPISMGRETYVRTTSGSSFVLSQTVDEVLGSIREVMA